jgi:hypothetical protein
MPRYRDMSIHITRLCLLDHRVGIAEILYEHGAKLDAKTSDDLTVCPGIVLLVANNKVSDGNIIMSKQSKHYLVAASTHCITMLF